MPCPQPPIRTAVSPEEFLEYEFGSEETHELVNGLVFLMAGGSRRHHRIAVRFGSLIENNSQNSS
jgi:Uma2 family endonuclease